MALLGDNKAATFTTKAQAALEHWSRDEYAAILRVKDYSLPVTFVRRVVEYIV